MRGPLTSGGAGGGRGGRGGDLGHPRRGHGEWDVQDGAVPLRVVLGLLLLPAAAAAPPRGLPSIGSLGPVDRRRAPAPAATHADPNGGLLIRRAIAAAGGLLGRPGAHPEGGGLPAPGLEADLDLSEPGLADGGGAQQARAAHGDQRNNSSSLERAEELGTPRLSSSPSRGSLSSFPMPSLLSPALPPSLPPPSSLMPCLIHAYNMFPYDGRNSRAFTLLISHRKDTSLLPRYYLLSKTLWYDLKAHLIVSNNPPLQLWETGGRLFPSSGAINWQRVSFAAPPFTLPPL